MAKLIGNAPNQVPTNADLGELAFLDKKFAGITMADQWRLTAGLGVLAAGAGVDITSNLERVDEPSFGYIGTGMTESSGVFSFPTTGIYKVEATSRFSGANAFIWGVVYISVSTDGGSTFDQANEEYTNKDANAYATGHSGIFVDVTNTSNVKVKFSAKSSTTSQLDGNTDENHTSFTFMRLGDT